MKIAYFLDFPYDIGGSNKVLLNQAYIMNKKGYKTIVIIPDDKERGHSSAYDKICKEYGLNTITAEFHITTCMEAIDIISVFENYQKIFQLLEQEKVDLIHSTQINVTVEMAARELHIPHLMNIYQTDMEMFNIKWLDVYPHYHSADSILFSERWKEGLHISSRCIRVAYQDDLRKISDRKIVVSELHKFIHLLCIGVLAERKNQLEIIKFVLTCKKNGIQVILTLLGNNNTIYGEKCKNFVKENNLEKDVIFEGFVLNVADYFESADLMILASTVESFPGVIVESMANKTPILSTPVAGVPELLKDGYNAFLTKGFQMQDFYEAFIRYLSYKKNGTIQNIIECAYKTYLENHSYEVIEEQLEGYYDWILKDYDNKCQQFKIEDIKKIFGEFIDKNCLENETLRMKSDIWFLYHLDKKIKNMEPQRIAIWGAGLWGKTALKWMEVLGCKDKVIGFIDTYKTGNYLNYPILKAKRSVILTCDLILVAIGNEKYCLDIMSCLDRYGKKRNRDYYMMLNGPVRI